MLSVLEKIGKKQENSKQYRLKALEELVLYFKKKLHSLPRIGRHPTEGKNVPFQMKDRIFKGVSERRYAVYSIQETAL